jgi:hypothetical protein
VRMFNPLDAGLEVEVKDPPKGMIPPGTQMVKPKAEPQPSKVRPTHLTPRTPDNTHSSENGHVPKPKNMKTHRHSQ